MKTNNSRLGQGRSLSHFRVFNTLIWILSVSIFCLSIFAQTDQSFQMPQAWANELTPQKQWGTEHPRLLGDVNADRRKDIVGFGDDGVYLGISNGTNFQVNFALGDFGYHQAWRVQKHVRLVGDINGDGRDDIVGFGNQGVYRALSTGNGLTAASFVLAEFGYDQGWRVENHVRLLADVNGDRRKDIVGFADDGVWLALATAEGSFSAPRFVVADFGFNQAWRPNQHIRTMADVNGDGRADIVGFGIYGVMTALSNGAGFAAPQFVLADFGTAAGGWQVDRHPRLMADVNRDGRQDIVAFGDDGAYVARSTGNGFEPAQFVVANFGYNSGWRVSSHPRFVADLNGDGYQDLVGFGGDAIYRALGSPQGFGAMRAVMRLGFSESNFGAAAFRLCGDVDGDNMSDLIGFDYSVVRVSRSSNQPVPLPPFAPTRVQITNSTTSSLTITWNDNSQDEMRFLIHYSKSGSPAQITTAGKDATTRTIGSLTANTNYCVQMQAENLWGISGTSSTVCGVTKPPVENNGPFTTSITMKRQPVTEGPIPYAGTFGPITSGSSISKINFPTQFPAVVLLKPNRSTKECWNPDAVVRVHGDMTPEQIKAVWGKSTITLTGQQSLPFVGCSLSPQLLEWLPVNITWSKPIGGQ